MRNPLRIPLRSSQPSDQTNRHGDQLVQPTGLAGDDYAVNYPATSHDVYNWQTNTSDDYHQDTAPEYAETYDLRYQDVTGPRADYGSNVYRDTDSVQSGQPGTNRGSVTVGPVRGDDSEQWTWQSIRPGAVFPGYYGPVTGFGEADQSQRVTRAYFQNQAAQYAEEYAAAALLAVT